MKAGTIVLPIAMLMIATGAGAAPKQPSDSFKLMPNYYLDDKICIGFDSEAEARAEAAHNAKDVDTFYYDKDAATGDAVIEGKKQGKSENRVIDEIDTAERERAALYRQDKTIFAADEARCRRNSSRLLDNEMRAHQRR
jgi:hypothetical protein